MFGFLKKEKTVGSKFNKYKSDTFEKVRFELLVELYSIGDYPDSIQKEVEKLNILHQILQLETNLENYEKFDTQLSLVESLTDELRENERVEELRKLKEMV